MEGGGVTESVPPGAEDSDSNSADSAAVLDQTTFSLDRILQRIQRIGTLVDEHQPTHPTRLTRPNQSLQSDMTTETTAPDPNPNTTLNPAAPPFIPRAVPQPRPPGSFRSPRHANPPRRGPQGRQLYGSWGSRVTRDSRVTRGSQGIRGTRDPQDQSVIEYPDRRPRPHIQSTLSYLTDSEDICFVNTVIETIFKLDGSIHGTFVQDMLREGGLQQAITKFLSFENATSSAPYIMMATLPLYAQTFLLRELYSSIICTRQMSRSIVIDLNTPYGQDLSLVVYQKDVHHDQPAAHNCELFLTTLDLLSVDRNGFYVHQNMPQHLKHRPCPFFFLYSQLSRNEYTWMEREVRSLRVTEIGQRLVHRHWAFMMSKGIYNDSRQWVFPSRRRLKKHLEEEEYSCCLCLGNEDEDDDDDNTDPDNPDKDAETQENKKKELDPKQFLELPCSHIFHLTCFCKIQPSSTSGRIVCPLCRSTLDVLEL